MKETLGAINRIHTSLKGLNNKKDASSYTYAMAMMMKTVFAQDEACSVNIDVKLEGRRLSRMMKKIPANENCR